MKIILSRKGFDSSLGGYPSPILPDEKMVSVPIPLQDNLSYSDLVVEDDLTFYDLMKQLRPKIKIGGKWQILNKETKCHLDPDIYRNVIPRKSGWRPCFGQIDAAQSHLEKQGFLAVVYIVTPNGDLRNFNRMLVDAGHAKIDDYKDNEFDPYSWWR